MELSREAESRSIDTIEEWRAKSNSQPATNAAATPAVVVPIAVLLQPSRTISFRDDDVRARSKEARARSRWMGLHRRSHPSHPTSLQNLSHQERRRRRKGTEASLADLLSPDKAHHKNPVASTKAPKPPPALRDLYALSGLGSQAETPVRRFIRWLAKEQLKSTIAPLVLLTAFLVRWIVGRGDWSGRGSNRCTAILKHNATGSS